MRPARFAGSQAANGATGAGPAQAGAGGAGKRPARAAAAAAAAATALSVRGVTVPAPAPPEPKPSAQPSCQWRQGSLQKLSSAAKPGPLRRLRQFEADGETFRAGDAAFLVTEDGGDYQARALPPMHWL